MAIHSYRYYMPHSGHIGVVAFVFLYFLCSYVQQIWRKDQWIQSIKSKIDINRMIEEATNSCKRIEKVSDEFWWNKAKQKEKSKKERNKLDAFNSKPLKPHQQWAEKPYQTQAIKWYMFRRWKNWCALLLYICLCLCGYLLLFRQQ